jgi:hypothetical protein
MNKTTYMRWEDRVIRITRLCPVYRTVAHKIASMSAVLIRYANIMFRIDTFYGVTTLLHLLATFFQD